MNNNIEPPSVWQVTRVNHETTGWMDSIRVADGALGEATRIQDGIRRSLKLQMEVRALKEELRKAYAEAHRYKGMHARVVLTMRQLENDHAADVRRLQVESDSLLVRHRVYKMLTEHYALVALRFSAKVLVEHRKRVLQHVLFHKRRGRPLTELAAVGGVTSKLL